MTAPSTAGGAQTGVRTAAQTSATGPDAEALSWPHLLATLLSRQDLTRADTAWAMERVMTADATPVELAGFLVALRAKGETVEELSGLVDTMLRHAVRIEVPGRTVDVVGTGGDRRHTVNISTTAAVVVAGAGRRVVKHGNRAASSASGAADVLEALGLRLDLPAQRVAELATEVGITFCFAPMFHPSYRHAAVARRELGVPTAFNFLGPLTNPAQPAVAAVGVADTRMAPIVAGVLAGRGATALVFRGDDGLDEITTAATSTLWVAAGGEVVRRSLDPAALGVPRSTLADLRGGDARHNAEVVRAVLAGTPGPVRDAVLLNAAAALVAADAHEEVSLTAGRLAAGLDDRLAAALTSAAAAVDSGAATAVLERWVRAAAA
ncbi:MAG TPA: anthranilate phosphoribosyltransferase [Kineosporiaceae bacterium]|nr:anthranilate phosphoribosyltransferase [Kineosporiaceae bacterium]